MYQKMSYRGTSKLPWDMLHVYSKCEMIETLKAEQIRGKVKPKFSPVYKKQNNET